MRRPELGLTCTASRSVLVNQGDQPGERQQGHQPLHLMPAPFTSICIRCSYRSFRFPGHPRRPPATVASSVRSRAA